MVKIDTIVREALADKGYNFLHLYPRYLYFAIRMLRNLNIDSPEELKSVRIRVTARRTVPYPDDYIAYSKLGIKVGDRIWAFVRDNTITGDHKDKYTANEPFFPTAEAQLSTVDFFNFTNNDGTRSLFEVKGYAHNGIGYFNEIPECKEFQLSADVKAKTVLLEYIADSFNPDTETFVPVLAQDVVREYIHYQDMRFRKGESMTEKTNAEREFLERLSDYDMRLSNLSYDGIMDLSRRQATLAPKF